MGTLRFGCYRPASPHSRPLPSGREYRPLRRLPGQFLQRLGEVLSVVQEKHAAGASLHEKRDEGCVGLGRVAIAAGEDQVVGAVIGVLAAARTDVVERNRLRSRLDAAIGADRAVFGEEPLAMTGVGATGGPAEGRSRDCRGVRAGTSASSGCSCHKPCLKCRTRSGPSGPPNALSIQPLKVPQGTLPRQPPHPRTPPMSAQPILQYRRKSLCQKTLGLNNLFLP